MLKVSVYRYNPDQDAAPFMQEFEVNTNGKDLMVLDVLALIKEQDEGFSYRRSRRRSSFPPLLRPPRRRPTLARAHHVRSLARPLPEVDFAARLLGSCTSSK